MSAPTSEPLGAAAGAVGAPAATLVSAGAPDAVTSAAPITSPDRTARATGRLRAVA